MILAGRLTGSVDGRPVVIDADESGLTVSFSVIRSAWAARRSVAAVLPVLAFAKRSGIALRLDVAGIVALDVLPVPGAIIRLLAPRLAALV